MQLLQRTTNLTAEFVAAWCSTNCQPSCCNSFMSCMSSCTESVPKNRARFLFGIDDVAADGSFVSESASPLRAFVWQTQQKKQMSSPKTGRSMSMLWRQFLCVVSPDPNFRQRHAESASWNESTISQTSNTEQGRMARLLPALSLAATGRGGL